MDYTVIDNQELLKGQLRNENLFVTFTKKDGQERKMLCTLLQDRIGAGTTPSAEPSSRAVSTTSLAVYDLDKQAWRSFRWDSITGVEAE